MRILKWDGIEVLLIIRVINKIGNILEPTQKKKVFILAGIMIIGGLFELCSVSLILPFMETVMNPKKVMSNSIVKCICSFFGISSNRTFLVFISILIALLYIIKNVYLLFEYNLQYKFVCNNMFAMQRDFLDALIHRPYEYFLSINSGEVVRIVNSDTMGAFYCLTTLLELSTEVIVSAMLIVSIFIMAPVVTVCVAVVLLLLLLFISVLIRPVLQVAGVQSQKTVGEMNQWVLQSVQGIKEIKVSSTEDFFINNFSKSGMIYSRSYRLSKILGMAPRFLIEAVSMGTIFIVIAVILFQGESFENLIPMLSVVAMGAIRILPSVNRIASAYSTIVYNEPMLDKVVENLQNLEKYERVKKDTNSNKKCREKIKVPILQDSIDIKELCYKYPMGDKDILSNVNVSIKRGDTVGIVGPSGAGKTTTVDIILGLLNPYAGGVFIDNINIKYDINNWISQIGYIPQSIFMLDGSIKENVSFGLDKIDEDKVWMALEEASLAKFVRNIPDGIETEIGERGVRLSGGQKQRIGIARALYRNPSVLIFDEATSALDNNTEGEIMKSIYDLQGEKTIIIIAHRLTTVEKCDHILQVEGGKITIKR